MTNGVEEIRARLEAIEAHVHESRAAAELIGQGDTSAAAELSREIDAMAEEVAALKAATTAALS